MLSTVSEIDALADRIAETFAQINLLSHTALTDLRHFDQIGGWAQQGARTCAHWLAWRASMDLQTAREHVRVARALGSMPKIDAAFRACDLSFSKVRAMTRVATPENEARLVELAVPATAAQLVKVCRAFKQVVSGSGDDPLAPPDERRSFTRRELGSGLVQLSVQVRPEEAAVIEKALEVALGQLRPVSSRVGGSSAEESPVDSAPVLEAASEPEEPIHGASRERVDPVADDDDDDDDYDRDRASVGETPSRDTPLERGRHGVVEDELCGPGRVDALVAVCESFLASQPPTSVPGRHEVTVYVQASTGAGDLPDGSQLGPETVKRLLCDGPVVTVVETDGTLGSTGRKRTIPVEIRRQLLARDAGCRFPGCVNRIWVDAHHIVHWADGGETNLANLVLTCRFHHRCLHEGGFRIERAGDGFVFFDPLGREIAESPRLPDLGANAAADLEAARARDGIGPETGAPRWDGTRLNLGAAVDALLGPRPAAVVDPAVWEDLAEGPRFEDTG